MVRIKIVAALGLLGGLIFSGCLPPKTVIARPETRLVPSDGVAAPETKNPSEEEVRLERLIRQLEETEKRLLETQRKTDEALKKVEKASQKTEKASERIQKAQEKMEAVDKKAKP